MGKVLLSYRSFVRESAKDKFRFFLRVAFGFFLGMRYNEYFTNLLEMYLPLEANGSLAIRGLILVAITLVIVYLMLVIEGVFKKW